MKDKEKAPLGDGAKEKAEKGLGDSAIIAQSPARDNGHLDIDALAEKALDVQAQDENPAPDLNDYNLTDAGNAEAIVALYGNVLRYDHARRKWLIWDNHRWTADDNGGIRRLAIDVARSRLRAAADIDDSTQRKKAASWALASESRHRIAAALELAQALEPIADNGRGWDSDPWLLGCNNGVVDLRTGALRPGRKEDRITLSTGLDYDPDAQAPRWERFLQEIFAGDNALVEFIHLAVGYSLTGDTTEQVLFLCWGSGANGKSTLLNTLRAALGEYASNTPFSTFELTHRQSNTNDIAALAGKRLVTAAETAEARRLNEARVKAITGGDPVTARYLYQEFFTYTPAYKVWLAMNHKPRITGTDYGIWRRIRLIPFTQQFTGDKADPALERTLQAELPGILAWAVRGALKWRESRLTSPPAVVAATSEYRQESDIIGRYLDERTTKKPGASVRASELYKDYIAWCTDNGERPVSRTVFGNRLADHGLPKERASAGNLYRDIILL